MKGIAICHYNRLEHLEEIIVAVKDTVDSDVKVFVCDDGSTSGAGTLSVSEVCFDTKVTLIQGPNLGVAANKNRALWALQHCDYAVILEDDLKPVTSGWLDIYVNAFQQSGIHHFCRVQDSSVISKSPEFDSYMQERNMTPIYKDSPRGDLTFITNEVIKKVGAFNPRFIGAGFAHGEWSNRVFKAGLIEHPNKWVDIKEASTCFEQIGDTKGGRWDEDEKVKNQIIRNREVLKELNSEDYIYHPLVLR